MTELSAPDAVRKVAQAIRDEHAANPEISFLRGNYIYGNDEGDVWMCPVRLLIHAAMEKGVVRSEHPPFAHILRMLGIDQPIQMIHPNLGHTQPIQHRIIDITDAELSPEKASFEAVADALEAEAENAYYWGPGGLR